MLSSIVKSKNEIKKKWIQINIEEPGIVLDSGNSEFHGTEIGVVKKQMAR